MRGRQAKAAVGAAANLPEALKHGLTRLRAARLGDTHEDRALENCPFLPQQSRSVGRICRGLKVSPVHVHSGGTDARVHTRWHGAVTATRPHSEREATQPSVLSPSHGRLCPESERATGARGEEEARHGTCVAI